METVLHMTDRQAELADFIYNIKQYGRMKLHTNQRWDILLHTVHDSDLYVELTKVKSQDGAIQKAWEVFCRPAWLLDKQAKGKHPTHTVQWVGHQQFPWRTENLLTYSPHYFHTLKEVQKYLASADATAKVEIVK